MPSIGGITAFDKAIAGLVVPIVCGALVSIFHITLTDSVSQAVGVIVLGLLTAASVYVTKNKPAAPAS